jgi:hypothetical protein
MRIYITSVLVDDQRKEVPAAAPPGRPFTQEPVETGDVMTVVFDDTCGNLIQIAKA